MMTTETVSETFFLSLNREREPPQWLTQFRNRGWAVVPEAIPKDKALQYADKGYDWLESWGLGFNRNDFSTRKAEMLPWHTRGGLYIRYGVGHEQFVWDMKTEPGLVEKFEMIWGTKELLASYDGVNLSVPDKDRPKNHQLFAPWSHVDQSPLRTNFDCAQGILNLLPNGPEDGGLMVLDGSNKYYTELWEHFAYKKPTEGWSADAKEYVDEEMCQWLEAKGCKWVKVCAQPGDLMVWDSRTVHYGRPPSSDSPRFAAYVCFKPASMVSEETKKFMLETYAKGESTTHDPAAPRSRPRAPPEGHPSYAEASRRPFKEPVLSERGKQLAGLKPY